MKRIAISQRVDHHPTRNEARDALDQRLNELVTHLGMVPFPVPNSLCCGKGLRSRCYDDLDNWLSHVSPSGIILSGGNDIGQCSERDATEHRLLDYAEEMTLPVFGICRGMQFLCVRAGCPLHETSNHVNLRHDIVGEIFGNVNSYHALGIRKCPNSYKVLAKTLNGEIEAIQHLWLPWEGWMWHPERERTFKHEHIERLSKLFRS